ncbi:transketolase [Ferrithrix thermotolerans DSM 19514]|uniref:Transketolase n=1 Tax=Ferrithrix thermotolerans DSM 19514 TaxID=1121881 RepID=A0A1M4SAE0_9ACTN|nr:transketolase [Ferrithrix thermotolerans]SHE29160.1 transketolase [Ferrithrix thermotolerans DSM 19514]
MTLGKGNDITMEHSDHYRNELLENDLELLTALRMLSIDQVEAANSGHPGLPLGAAPIVHTVFSRFLRYDPFDPSWVGRDRFVLSAGHGSALLYATLYLYGSSLGMDDLKQFRKLGSKTPGHPEFGHTPGVETTTGPLGQGVATSVGIALAQKLLAEQAFRSDPLGSDLLNQRTYVLASDGDLMEGISHEAASLAGNLGLDNLVVLFDSNNITIDGPASQSCTDDVTMRFGSYGWKTYEVHNGNDIEEISQVLRNALEEQNSPVLIEVKTTIGSGSPNRAGTSKVHGSPLGKEETALTKAAYGWSYGSFELPEHLERVLTEFKSRRQQDRQRWESALHDLGEGLYNRVNESLKTKELQALPTTVFNTGAKLATRKASKEVLADLCGQDHRIVGGAADLAESNGVDLGLETINRSSLANHTSGQLIHFGIREHAMAACANGLALSGNIRPFCSTFLVFSDYLRPSLRLSALMSLPVIYIFTHDSIALGEDGPTHQPVEHLSALRAIPNHIVLRPADANETKACYEFITKLDSSPVSLILTRQDLEILEPTPGHWLSTQGARVVQGTGTDQLTIVASGSEVQLALESARLIEDRFDVNVRVVSVPWRERFLSLERDVFEQLVPPNTPVIVIEAGIEQGWESLSSRGTFIGMNSFGASGSKDSLFEHFGFTPNQVLEAASDLLSDQPSKVANDLLLATELAALHCQDYVGKGEKNQADHAAVEALRNSLASASFTGTVVIGEGAKDEAPMLYEGEVVGSSSQDAQQLDIAVDPLEGTNYAAKGTDGAISVIAVAKRGSMLPMPAYYMEKLVTRFGSYDELSLDRRLIENLEVIAAHKGAPLSSLCAYVLDKPRHKDAIAMMRGAGVRVIQASDGDVLGSLRALLPMDTVDLLYGIGGAPEGVISAAATRGLGGYMIARLTPQSEEETASLASWNPGWSSMRFTANDLVSEESIMVATAVTSTSIIRAPERLDNDDLLLHSVVVENGRIKFISRPSSSMEE